MDVRLLIVWHPTDIYQVGVLAPVIPASWMKTYSSKTECVTELLALGSLTEEGADEVLASDFDAKDHILIVHTQAEPEKLIQAGFKETHPDSQP